MNRGEEIFDKVGNVILDNKIKSFDQSDLNGFTNLFIELEKAKERKAKLIEDEIERDDDNEHWVRVELEIEHLRLQIQSHCHSIEIDPQVFKHLQG